MGVQDERVRGIVSRERALRKRRRDRGFDLRTREGAVR